MLIHDIRRDAMRSAFVAAATTVATALLLFALMAMAVLA